MKIETHLLAYTSRFGASSDTNVLRAALMKILNAYCTYKAGETKDISTAALEALRWARAENPAAGGLDPVAATFVYGGKTYVVAVELKLVGGTTEGCVSCGVVADPAAAVGLVRDYNMGKPEGLKESLSYVTTFSTREKRTIDDLVGKLSPDVDIELQMLTGCEQLCRPANDEWPITKLNVLALYAREINDAYDEVMREEMIDAARTYLNTAEAPTMDGGREAMMDTVDQYLVKNAENLPDTDMVCFQGGGSKVTSYTGVVDTLVNTKVWPKVRVLAGTSGGGGVASLAAFGVLGPELDSAIKKMTIGCDDWGDKYEDRCKHIKLAPRGINQSGLVNALTIPLTFEQCVVAQLEQYFSIHPEMREKAELRDVVSKVDMAKAQMSGPNFIITAETALTFGDLETLHDMDPATFKSLRISGTNYDTQQLVVFSHESHRDLPIGVALKATTALPLVFRSVLIDGSRVGDGGLVTNSAYGCINEDDDKEKLMMVQPLDRETSVRRLYSEQHDTLTPVEKYVGTRGVTGYDTNELADSAHAKEMAVRTVSVPIDGVNTLEFSETSEMHTAARAGRVAAQSYLYLRCKIDMVASRNFGLAPF